MFQFFYFKFIYINLYIILKSKENIINTTTFIESSIPISYNKKEYITKNIIEERNFNENINSPIIKTNNNLSFLYNINNLKKNLLIGALKNFNWDIIEPFFESFKRAKFQNCECVIFYDRITQYTINKIKSYGVIVYEIPIKFRNVSIINCRWKIYEDFIDNNKDKYKLVFTVDLRDSFFQRDVFKDYENYTKPFLGVAIEDGILSQPINKNWLINAYGEELYKTIEHERIICVGTIWGTIDKFSEFSKIMWEKLNSKWSIMNNVIEQAVGNFLIYHDKLFNDCLIKSFNNNGSIMTISLTNDSNIKLDNEDNVLNKNGEIAAIVHQYDRKPFIVSKIKKKFCIENKKENNINKDFNKLFLIFGFSLIIIIIFIILFWLLILVIRYLLNKILKKKFKKKKSNTLVIMKIY